MKYFIIISAPSGSGKTTLCRALEKKDPKISFSISCTTRPRRNIETEGVDYFFVDNNEFKKMVDRDEFAEYEEIHGNYFYGTLKRTLDDSLREKKILLLELDVQGAMSVKKLYPDNNLSIFVLPPSLEDLRTRLKKRGTDSPERISKRLERLSHEMEYKKYFDHVVINDQVDHAVDEIIEIIKHENKGMLYGS